MRKVLVAGNWKMHLNTHEASLLVHRLSENIQIHRDIEVVLAPTLLTLQPLSLQIDRRKFRLASQNAYFKDEGAFTGEVSFNMLRDLVHYAIIGHSERRHIFGEDLPTVRDKVRAAIRNGITPILCVGETGQERKDGETKRVIHDQLTTALSNLTAHDIASMVVAYEPVWAIGSGQPEKPADTREVCGYIRSVIHDLYGEAAAQSVRLLYGGSVTPEVAKPFLSEAGVDGFLVGHESLNWHDFSAIIDEAYAWQREGGE